METNLKILVCDDSSVTRAILQGALKELGYSQIGTANDGKDAVDQLSAAQESDRPFELLFLDINMPVMNGLEVIEELRCKRNDQIPIVIVSAESERDVVMSALKQGVNNYVIKPFRKESIEKVIASTLGTT